MTYPLIFFGTSNFAVPSLEALIHDPRFEILGVVTQPDRPVGRHAVMASPAVKQHVLTTHSSVCTIHQPEKLHDEPFASWMREVGPTCDAFVVVSYGKILPQWLLDLPKKGAINIHGSLLPRWRGPSPIQAAIAAGEKKTGVTIMRLDAAMDHGPILAQAQEFILRDDTGGALHDRLALQGAHILPNTLDSYLDETLTPVEQDHSRATYCKLLTRNDGRLDLTKTATELERLIRAYNPWPETWMEIDGKRIKLLSAKVIAPRPPLAGGEATRKSPVGTRFIVDELPAVTCGHGTALEITHLQLEGCRAASGTAYLHGHRWTEQI